MIDEEEVNLEAEIAAIKEEMRKQAEITFRITHHYDIGNQDVYIERREGSVDAKRAALYCQFMCEEWFGEQAILSNLGIASMLITFYGFRHAASVPSESCTTIDMHSDREAACGGLYHELMDDASLQRERLREYMAPHID